MLKRVFAVILSAVLVSLSTGSAGAQTVNSADARVRAAVTQLGVGEKARVEVRLLDKTKVKGYVSEAGPDSFTVMDSKTGAVRTFNYADVAEVRRRPRSMSNDAKVIFWGAIAAGAVVGLLVLREATCDGQC